MDERDPTPADFVGKTITEFDGSAINVWRFGFSDGSAIAVTVEPFGSGLYGMCVSVALAAELLDHANNSRPTI